MPELIYLDNSATAFPKPECVIDYMSEFSRNYGVNPGRSGYDLSIEAGLIIDNARRLLDAFFNNPAQDHNRLVFANNASDALNMIIQGICNRGDHVISTQLEHNSVLRPLYVMEQNGLLTHELVPFDGNGYVDPDEIERRFRNDTRLVIVNHGSNVIGTVQPVAEIGRRCRRAGITFAVDVAQTAGMIPIDMKEMCIDVLAFTGHKSLMGPTGIGGMAVGPDVEIRSTRWGGTGVKSAVRTHLEEYPYRCEVGTLNTVGIAGLYEAMRYLGRTDLSRVRTEEMQLAQMLIDGLSEIAGVRMYCAGYDEAHLPVVACNLDGWEAGDLGMLLDADYDIATRTGLHCAPLVHEGIGTAPKGTVRFSIGPFNIREHIEAVLKAVREIAAMRLGRASVP